MEEFTVTETAGKEVGGIANPGAGKTITLSEAQAEHPLRLGHIVRRQKKATVSEPQSGGESRRSSKRR